MPRDSVHLEPGQQKVAEIQARPKWNDTTVQVKQGESYQLSATGKWFDASIECGPEGYTRERVGRSKRWLFRLTEGLRRAPKANWFQLVVTIGQDLKTEFVPVTQANAPPATLNVTRDGILFGFANDLSWFYGNNSGSVMLTVERVA